MKKLLMTLLCSTALVLTGCSSQIKSADTQKKMEKQGYTVTVYPKEEAQKRYATLTYNVEITDALYAQKENDLLIAFYCKTSDDATKFVQDNIAQMAVFAQLVIENPKTGSHNNVAYVGSETSISYAGLPV